jgi:hypothetical protein
MSVHRSWPFPSVFCRFLSVFDRFMSVFDRFMIENAHKTVRNGERSGTVMNGEQLGTVNGQEG